MCCKAGCQLNVLRRIGSFIEEATRLLIYKCSIKSHFDYCSLVWYNCGIGNSKKLERIQEHALRFVIDDTSSDYEIPLHKTNTSTLEFQRKHQLVTEVFKTLHDLNPPYMKDIFKLKVTSYTLRGYFRLEVPMVDTTTYGLHSLQYTTAITWNDIPDSIKVIDNLAEFKSIL